MIRLRGASATDVGQVRPVNQDSLLVADGLFVVADGMGGHRGGEVASDVAVRTLVEEFDGGSPEGLRAAVERANRAVVAHAEDDPTVKGMGTTVCALAAVSVDGQELLAAVNVGDSRLYLCRREGGLEQVTEDHSLVATLERQGQLTAEEAAVHPHRNILTRALGIDAKVLVDLFELRPLGGDRYLLCSDGLFNEVSEPVIEETLRELADPQEAADRLVQMANAAGGRDNISVVVVDVVPDDEHPAEGPGGDRIAAVLAAEDALADEIREAAEDDRPPAAAGRDRADEPSTAPPTRFTWRVALFLFAVVVVVFAAVGLIVYYANASYTLTIEDDELVVYRGRDVLVFSSELDQRCGIPTELLKQEQVRRLEDGIERTSEADVRALILNSVTDRDAPEVTASPCLSAGGGRETTTTSTTAPSATASSTTAPADDTSTSAVEGDAPPATGDVTVVGPPSSAAG